MSPSSWLCGNQGKERRRRCTGAGDPGVRRWQSYSCPSGCPGCQIEAARFPSFVRLDNALGPQTRQDPRRLAQPNRRNVHGWGAFISSRFQRCIPWRSRSDRASRKRLTSTLHATQRWRSHSARASSKRLGLQDQRPAIWARWCRPFCVPVAAPGFRLFPPHSAPGSLPA